MYHSENTTIIHSELIFGTEIFDRIDAQTWDALAARSMTDTPFQRYAYQKAWWTHLGRGELVSVVVRDDDGLKGLGCFFVEDGRVLFNGSKEETDYLDLICAADEALAVWTAVLEQLQTPACPAWTVLDCYNIPHDSPSREILPRLADSRGFAFQEERAEVCPVIPLADTFEEYLMNIDKKQRHEIRRKFRRADGAEAEFEFVGPEDDLTAAVDEFLDLLQHSTPEKEAWLNDGRTAVFHEVAEAAMRDGSLLLMFVRVRGKRWAGLFNFIHNGRVYVYNSGLDLSRHSRLSLGVVLTAKAIEYGIEQGCTVFDFLRGDETYKYRFGAADSEIFRLQLHTEAQAA